MTEKNSEPIVTDTWAWIEYFKGSDSGREVKEQMEKREKSEVIVPSVVIGELSYIYRREGKERLWEEYRKPFIEMTCFLMPLEKELADRAGRIKLEKREKWKDFGFSDAMIEATRRHFDGKLLTGDPHLLGEDAIDISS